MTKIPLWWRIERNREFLGYQGEKKSGDVNCQTRQLLVSPTPHGSWCQSKIWQPAGAPGAPCTQPSPPSPPPLHSLRAGPATCQLTSEQEAGPWRMSAVPLSILGLLLIGKKEIKFCSDEVLGSRGGGGCSPPRHCADSAVQGEGKRGRRRRRRGDYLGANTGTADCLRLLRTGGLHNRNH